MIMFGKSLSGAQNVSSFRKNIEKGNLPSEESITYEGLFNTYYFDTGRDSTTDLVSASYCVAQCPNILTGEVERYVSLGMNSVWDGKNHREPLNLVVVLDISGSMGSHFGGRRTSSSSEYRGSVDNVKKKMDVAKEVLLEIVNVITDKERLGIVLFDTRVEILQPLRKMSLIDKEDLTDRIKEVNERGGTNMEIGYRAAFEMLGDLEKDDEVKNSRIIFLTDAHPNTGGGPNQLMGMSEAASLKKIYTTYIGIGLDFNCDMINRIVKVRGANYFSVHSAREFQKILNDDFNYVVTPIAFNCLLFFESEGLEVERVYGTPYAEESTSVLTKLDSVCASAIDDEEGTKGSMILLKLKDKLTPKLDPSHQIRLTFRYENSNNGERTQNSVEFDFKQRMEEMIVGGKIFQNSGIRKAVLLAKYATLMRDTLSAAKQRQMNARSDGMGRRGRTTGSDSRISNEMKEDIKKFKKFFAEEMEVLKDKSLAKEIDAMDRLIYMK